MTRQVESDPQGGFTLIEVTLTTVILTVLLLGIGNVTKTANDAVEAHTRDAEVVTLARRNVQRISQFLRPAKLSSFRYAADASDVKAGLAKSVGEWIEPTDLSWRSGIQFNAAPGTLTMNVVKSTPTRELEFEMDAGEADNGIDDDGDGLVDEGQVRLLYDGVTVTVVRNVETCSFMLDGRMLNVSLRCAMQDSRGNVYRALVDQGIFMRNN